MNSSEKLDLETAMNSAEPEENKMLVNEEERYVVEVDKTINIEKDAVNR